MSQTIYIFSKKGEKGICKGPAIFRQKGNVAYPIAYIRKPRHASQEEFDAFIDYLEGKLCK